MNMLLRLLATAVTCRLVLFLACSHPASAQEVQNFSANNSDLIPALEAIQQYLANGSGGYFRLEIASGDYHLSGPNATALATFENVSYISIVGEGHESTVINGGGENGFVFREVSYLTIANLTFSNCWSLQNSTSTNNSEPGNLSYIEFSSALYLDDCSDIYMESTTVRNSQAVGVAMFNIYGTNIFRSCMFSDNSYPSSRGGDSGSGGGGVILEFSFCGPGDLSCNNSNPVEVSDASFEFSDCLFTGNSAVSREIDPTYPHGIEHLGFGKGGGLAVYFRGRSISNSVVLRNCHISYNKAQYGGGLYVEFGDESRENVFNYTSDGGVIGLNGAPCGSPGKNSYRAQTMGGGVMVVFIYYPPDPALWPGYHANVSGNRVEFHGTYISANHACWAGGVSVMSSRSRPQNNSLTFTNCLFKGNVAVSASALDVSVLQPDSGRGGKLITPSIANCSFSSNRANIRSSYLIPNLTGYQSGVGAVYLNRVPVKFSGDNYFSANNGSGLVVSSAEVFVTEGSSLVFERNIGKRGGALLIIGGGSLILYPGTRLSFSLNQALELGGAVYAEGELGQGAWDQTCFLRYHQPTLQPFRWNTTFVFSNNSVSGKEGEGTIYITSLIPCTWPGEDNSFDIGQALCWPGWVYDGHDASTLTDCSGYIATAPASFSNSDNNKMYQLSLYPGHETTIPVQTRDDYGKPVDHVVFHVYRDDDTRVEVANTSMYISNNKITLYGIPEPKGKTPDLFLETPGPHILTTVLKVTLLPCPPGYTPEYLEENRGMVRKCKCAYSLYFTCDSSDMSAHIQPGYCVRYQNSSSTRSHHKGQWSNVVNQTMIVVECPSTLKTGRPLPLPSCKNSSTCSLEEMFCESIGHKGRYCSRCASGSALDVNDIHNCVKCRSVDYHYGWCIYLLTNIVPITVFFVVVTLFRISTTSAPMYAFVFFAQVTSIQYFHNQLPWVYGLSQKNQLFRYLLLIPYSIWNLDFFIFTGVICLSDDLTPMYSLLLKYLLALYPMLLILLSYICIELYDHNYRVVVWFWRPFRACLKKYRRSWQPRTSIIDAFATFLMISYTKVTVITISLLTPAQQYYVFHERRSKVDDGYVFYFDPQYPFFQGPHLFMGLLALLVAIAFVLAPPLFLFLYPTKMFQRCLNRCSRRSWQTVHTFADAFQGCFKNHTNNNRDYRYFSGLYLVLRIVLLMIYAVETSQVVQLLLQQIVCTLAVLVFALVKPYKEKFFNKVDLSIFSLLALMNSFSFANFTNSLLTDETNTALFAINYGLGFLPLLYLSLYLLYLFLKWRGVIAFDPAVREITTGETTMSVASEDSSTTDIPDRLLHPENYTINSRTPPSSVCGLNSNTGSSADLASGDEKAAASSGRQRPSQRATEGSYFLKRGRNLKNYSSM